MTVTNGISSVSLTSPALTFCDTTGANLFSDWEIVDAGPLTNGIRNVIFSLSVYEISLGSPGLLLGSSTKAVSWTNPGFTSTATVATAPVVFAPGGLGRLYRADLEVQYWDGPAIGVPTSSDEDSALVAPTCGPCGAEMHYDETSKECVPNDSGRTPTFSTNGDQTACPPEVIGPPLLCATAFIHMAKVNWSSCTAGSPQNPELYNDPTHWGYDCFDVSFGGSAWAVDASGAGNTYMADQNGQPTKGHGTPSNCRYGTFELAGVVQSFPPNSEFECSNPAKDHLAWHHPIKDPFGSHFASTTNQPAVFYYELQHLARNREAQSPLAEASWTY
jgi:hypothetical protein